MFNETVNWLKQELDPKEKIVYYLLLKESINFLNNYYMQSPFQIPKDKMDQHMALVEKDKRLMSLKIYKSYTNLVKNIHIYEIGKLNQDELADPFLELQELISKKTEQLYRIKDYSSIITFTILAIFAWLI